MPTNDHPEKNSKIEQDADRYVTGRIGKKTWAGLWGHLNPLAYTTVPVWRMSTCKYRTDKSTSQHTGSTQVHQFAPAAR